MVSLRFQSGSHAIATSTSSGSTRLFDPNYGEFSVPSGNVPALLESLRQRYADPMNDRQLSSVTIQRVS